MTQQMKWIVAAAALLGGMWLIAGPAISRDAEIVGVASAPDAARGGWKTVRDFGAVGDGQADDTAAIQRAVDAGIGDIRFPAGRYRLTRPIAIDLERVGAVSASGTGTATLVMEGTGSALRISGGYRGSASPGQVPYATWQKQRMPVVEGLVIEGAHEEASGIEITGAIQAIVTRVAVRKAFHGVRLTGLNRNVIVSDCHLYDNRGVGLLMEDLNLHQVNVVGCHISYNRGGGIVVRGSEIRNLQIGTCDIEGNTSSQHEGTANLLLDARKRSIGEVAIVGCTIQHDHRAPNSANIRILGREPERGISYTVISGNALGDVTVNIHLQHVRGVSVLGNAFCGGYDHALLVENSSHVQVGTNNMDRHPGYGHMSNDNVLFDECHDCTVTGLHLTNTRNTPAGLVFRRCRWINVTGCTILDCEGGGLLLEETERAHVSGCTIRSSNADAPAVAVAGGRENVIAGNLVAGALRIGEGTAAIRDNVPVNDD